MNRRLALAVLLSLLVLGGGVVITAVVTTGGGKKVEPGRLAVVDGCGLLTMRPDGTDESEWCLTGIWAAVSASADGGWMAFDTVTGGQSGITVDDDGDLSPRQLALLPGANFEPSLAPDGRRVAFLHSARDDGRYDLWTSSVALANAEQLTTSRDVSAVAWSPAGTWIAYVQGWSPDTLEGDILLIRPDGGEERRLARGDEPAWSPDGRRLAFVRGGNVWAVEVDSPEPRVLVRNGHSPAWSRDGELLAFMRATNCGEPVCDERAYVVAAAGGPARPVGRTFAESRRLLWVPGKLVGLE